MLNPIMRKISQRRLVPLLLVFVAGVAVSWTLAKGFPSQSTYRYLKVFQEVWALTRANYVEPIDEPALLDGAYRGMLASLDAASAYLGPEEEALLARAVGSGHAGLEVLPSGGVPVVVRVDPGGGAEAAGLEPGDQIWKVGKQSTRMLAWPLLVRLLRGEPGSTLSMVVLDGRTFKMREVEVKLAAPSGEGFDLTFEEPGVVALRLRSLDALDTGALGRGVRGKLAEHPGAALLVDLRGVVGLDTDELVRLAGALIPGGELVRLVDRAGATTVVQAPDALPLEVGGGLFVLVDGSTAGVAEALALVLKERAGARLCGRETYGLGAVPERIPLRSGGSVLLATRQMFSPDGSVWTEDGITPDKEIAFRRVERGDDESARPDPMREDALSWIREGAPVQEPKEERLAS